MKLKPTTAPLHSHPLKITSRHPSHDLRSIVGQRVSEWSARAEGSFTLRCVTAIASHFPRRDRNQSIPIHTNTPSKTATTPDDTAHTLVTRPEATSIEKRKATKQSPSKHRVTLAAYMTGRKHMLPEEPLKAKTVRVIAAETGMSIRTARHWLERDHYDEWFQHWPSFAAIVADVQSERDPDKPRPKPIELPSVTAAAIAAEDNEWNADTINRKSWSR